jgi:hypothetical protein
MGIFRTAVLSVLMCPMISFAIEFNRTDISAASFYTPEEMQTAKYETSLSFLLFPESGWTQELILEHAMGLATVYLQCGLRISNISIFVSSELKLPPQLSKYEKSGPNSLLELSSLTTQLPRPLVFLIGGLSDTEASPFSRATFAGMNTPIPASLESTLWLPMYVNAPEYIEERKASPYSSLAHELTHLLTLDGEHNNDPIPNLMTIYHRRTNLLTSELCEEIVASPFVTPTPSSVQAGDRLIF